MPARSARAHDQVARDMRREQLSGREGLMNPNGSVTLWLEALRGQDNDAARQLWQRYFQRMVGLARKRLAGVDLRAFDEEDVALSAFNAFCMSLKDGRYPDLQHRDELWPFLTRITVRKARDWHQKHTALKRVPPGEQVSGSGIIDGNPSPDVEAIMQEECRRLIDSLADPVPYSTGWGVG